MVPTKKEVKGTKKPKKITAVAPAVELLVSHPETAKEALSPNKPTVVSPIILFEARYVGPFAEGQFKMRIYPRGVGVRVNAQTAEVLRTMPDFRVKEVTA